MKESIGHPCQRIEAVNVFTLNRAGQRNALTVEFIDHRQAFDPPSGAERTENEVHRPDLVGRSQQAQTLPLDCGTLPSAPTFTISPAAARYQ